jgi:predicted TIM-barrel fold metal-dependent hydrolase
MKPAHYSRRDFLQQATLAMLAAGAGCRGTLSSSGTGPIIDIHQHVSYSGRPDDNLLFHQAEMGVTRTILLPSGRPMTTASTLNGKANGLQAACADTEACYAVAKAHPKHYLFAANEVPDHPEALPAIKRYLDLGAVAIAEQKFGVECDSPEMVRLYELAADYGVPILMHWQHGSFNHGFERFGAVLKKFPRTVFIGHAQTWWANIDKNHQDQTVLYPKGNVTAGGLTDRYLADYPNVYADLSAGSGLNALTRDEAFTVDFFTRHQNKLMYGSDCNDRIGSGTACQGAQTIAAIRRLAPSRTIESKLLYANAKTVFKI